MAAQVLALTLFCASTPGRGATAAALDTAFREPAAAAKPWVFWYWMNAAVSKEGITADLAAMKQAGVAGAYLMPIKGPTEPPLLSPPVVQLTPQWWDCVRFAFAEADRLGLKLAFQDCDGFATAGGPWITPERSMQRVVWSETRIEGGQHVDVTLPQPQTNEDYYRDIAVFAVPSSAGANAVPTPVVTSSLAGGSPQFLAGTGGSEVFQSSAACWIQYAFPAPFTCRAVTIRLPPAANAYQPNTYQANRLAIEVSDDGQDFRRVAQLVPPRHGWQDGDADITHAIAPVTARYFRFQWDPAGAEPGAEDLDSAKWKPALKLRALTLSSEPTLHGFEGKSGAAWRITTPTTAAEVGPADAVPLATILDLTRWVEADGRLRWDAPPGHWRILRLGHTSTGHRNETGGGGRGLECDKFDPAVVRFQFDHWFGEVVRQVGPELARRVLQIFHVDSWECASQNWSPVFRDEFKRRRGYDPLPYLPAIAGVPVESAETSERFLHDVRTTIADLLADNFFGTLATLAREQGCEFSAESVAPTMVSDGMAHFARATLPMGEFWLRSPTHDKLNDILDAVSGARAYGRPIAQAEAFTELVLSWDEAPRMLKALQDRNYCFGINRFVFHVFAHNPWPNWRPGVTLSGVGLFFETNQTWMQPGKAWVDYTTRCQSLLQQGHPVADVAVFTGEEIPRRAFVPWALATTLPRMIQPISKVMAGRKTPQILNAADWSDPLCGYAYDSINRDALLRLATVRDGRLEMPGGGSYRILVLPANGSMDPIADRITPEVATKVREFVAGGGTVIVGARPTGSPSLSGATAADGVVRTVADALWPLGMPANGEIHRVGNGAVVTGPWPAEDFRDCGVTPDVTVAEAAPGRQTEAETRVREGSEPIKPELSSRRTLAWTHRAGDGWDLYFVSNQRDEARDVTLSFRVSGRQPELWDPVAATQTPAVSWRTEAGRAIVPLHLPASGSMFVVFRSANAGGAAGGGPNQVNGAEAPVAQTLGGTWQVQFNPAFGGPAQPSSFASLVSWTTRPEPAIRNYSGTASYTQTFAWHAAAGSKPGRVWLDLGAVRDIAEVSVNGVPCGVAWTAPFRVDVTAALHEGANELRIAVTNTWFNRLAGDAALPEPQRITWTTAPDRVSGKPLLDAGLLGPVTLRIE